jgi:hypothetical protein
MILIAILSAYVLHNVKIELGCCDPYSLVRITCEEGYQTVQCVVHKKNGQAQHRIELDESKITSWGNLLALTI